MSLYFNSSEPGCDGSDPNILWAEDFETAGTAGGHWYAEDEDAFDARNRNKGWAGTIFANPITPAGAQTTNGAGVGNSGYAGNHGFDDGGQGGRNMADHDFLTEETEIHVRWYQHWLAGYSFGAEKVLTFNRKSPNQGGIKFGNVHMNCGAGSPASDASLQWQPTGPTGGSCRQLKDPITSGTWWCIEIWIKLSTTTSSADGFLKAYVDNCGTDGMTHGGSQTLTFSETGMNFDRQNSGEKFGNLWFENWANPGSTGTSYIDQIVVSKAAIGFFTGEDTSTIPLMGQALL